MRIWITFRNGWIHATAIKLTKAKYIRKDMHEVHSIWSGNFNIKCTAAELNSFNAKSSILSTVIWRKGLELQNYRDVSACRIWIYIYIQNALCLCRIQIWIMRDISSEMRKKDEPNALWTKNNAIAVKLEELCFSQCTFEICIISDMKMRLQWMWLYAWVRVSLCLCCCVHVAENSQ